MKKDKEIKLPFHRASTVRALKSILDSYPDDAKIYANYEGVIIIYSGEKDLAKIELTGL